MPLVLYFFPFSLNLAGPESPFERGDGSDAGCSRWSALAGRQRRDELRPAGSEVDNSGRRGKVLMQHVSPVTL